MSEFSPDWTLAPAAALAEWMRDNGLTLGMLATRCGHGDADEVEGLALLIRDVLDRKPLLAAHAEMLERGTGIPGRTWLNYERIYRADLARGDTRLPLTRKGNRSAQEGKPGSKLALTFQGSWRGDCSTSASGRPVAFVLTGVGVTGWLGSTRIILLIYESCQFNPGHGLYRVH